MSHLSNTDLMQILRAIELLNAGTGMETLADHSLQCILSLIQNEMTAFDGFGTAGEYTGSYWYSPPGTVSEGSVRLFGELVQEHPYYHEAVLTQNEQTFRTSDYLSLATFHKTPLYNEFYKLFGGEAQMMTAMRVSPTSLVTCSVHRPTLDFTDCEVEMLKLITPHLKAAFANAQAFEKVDNERKCLTAAVHRGLVAINDHGDIIFINGTAEKLLQTYFSDSVPHRLPESLERHIKSQGAGVNGKDYYAPARPYRAKNAHSELIIRLAFDTQARQLTLIFEERIERTKRDFCGLGLTARESEIVLWMSKGKTDAEIAQICCISCRTVQKHVENLFVKLGVETRTAAVMAAIERLDD
jgi:DNA-binding CsgD family transcriptional regulator